jgi:hypothetical protein
MSAVKPINENETIKFQVKLNNIVLAERVSHFLAEKFVETLTREQQEHVEIVPVTQAGKQILFS